MNTARRVAFLFALATFAAHAEEVVNVSGSNCKAGAHENQQSAFALYVFCDDALGTNVAVFRKDIGAPSEGPYDLGKRFWQGQKWSYDVTSYAWLKDGRLLLATSEVYGSDAVYVLDVENQKAKVVLAPKEDGCLPTLKSVEGNHAKVEMKCQDSKDHTVEIAI